MAAVTEGRLSSGLPYLRLGRGSALVMVPGGSARHASPAGPMRSVSLAAEGSFARQFTVYLTSRKPGLAAGCTIAGIAGGYARAIEEDIGAPVMLSWERPGPHRVM